MESAIRKQYIASPLGLE